MSCAAREVRLKLVIQAIPTFSMSCFKLTQKVCKGISSSMAKYWWSSSLDRRSMHWVDWDTLASAKVGGGMGFRNLEIFNLAMLGKHGWRLTTSPGSVCARVLKGRYYPSFDFMQATVPRGASATLRAIVAGREALNVGMIRRIGDETSVLIWADSWVQGKLSMRPSAQIGTAPISRVSDLIDSDNWSWKVDLIRNNFVAPDADAILNIPLRQGGGDDFWAWA